MKRSFWLAAGGDVWPLSQPAWAQQDDVARLRAELQRQQEVIGQLLKRLDELEKKQALTATNEELKQEAETQQDAVESVREIAAQPRESERLLQLPVLRRRVAGAGLASSSTISACCSGSSSRSSTSTWSSSSRTCRTIPRSTAKEEEGEEDERRAAEGTDISGEGQVAVENAWMEYNHNRFLNVRVGKQLSPQYWWQNHYPNLTLSTDQPIYLRELFPPELVGVMVHGSAARPSGAVRARPRLQVLPVEQPVRGQQPDGPARRQVVGRAAAGEAADRRPAEAVRRGRRPLPRPDRARDPGARRRSRVRPREPDRSRSLPAPGRIRARADARRDALRLLRAARRAAAPTTWTTFYRIEQLDSPRIQRAERRHLAGLNFRPYAQIALKAEYYRGVPLQRSFIRSEEERTALQRLRGGGRVLFLEAPSCPVGGSAAYWVRAWRH